MIHCYGLYGAGGRAYSAGIEDKLATRLRQLPGVLAPATLAYGGWQLFAISIYALPLDEKVVLIGHSLGAAMCTHLAHQVYPRRIALLVGYDPTLWSRQMPIPDNVDSVIEFHGRGFFGLGSWVNPLRLNLLKKGAAEFKSYNSADAHIRLDDDDELHAIVVKRVAAL